MNIFQKAFTHIKTIIVHKHFVFKYCVLTGIPIRGILHDLSKFSPAELFLNIKYTEKGTSPVAIQKKKFGYCSSWMHHKSRNLHHYEYWMDRFDDGCYVTRMPYKYTVEMLCDYLGANAAYSGNTGKNSKEIYKSEYNWWQTRRDSCAMHPDNKRFLDVILGDLYDCSFGPENKYLDQKQINKKIKRILGKKNLTGVYKIIIRESEYQQQVKIQQKKKRS